MRNGSKKKRFVRIERGDRCSRWDRGNFLYLFRVEMGLEDGSDVVVSFCKVDRSRSFPHYKDTGAIIVDDKTIFAGLQVDGCYALRSRDD